MLLLDALTTAPLLRDSWLPGSATLHTCSLNCSTELEHAACGGSALRAAGVLLLRLLCVLACCLTGMLVAFVGLCQRVAELRFMPRNAGQAAIC